MNKYELEQRIKKLEVEAIQMQTAYAAAIQECRYWLKELEDDSQRNTE